MIYIILICLIIIGFLGYKLFQKQKIDKHELEEYNEQLLRAKLAVEMQNQEITQAKEKRKYEQSKLEECKKDIQTALDTYNNIVNA